MKNFELHTKLDDGTPILIRPLRPEDKDSIKEGFERISLRIDIPFVSETRIKKAS